jgi:hypothetical protein
MFFLTILIDYLYWHYTKALVSYIRIYKNFFVFVVQLFSIGELLKSLFSPYKRIVERHETGFDIGLILSDLLINTVSRIIGLIIRLCIILAGLLSVCVLTMLALCLYAIWLVAPMLLVVCFFTGLYLII